MYRKISDKGFKVLNELNHNENGNPHDQYVGRIKDCWLRPTFDETLMQEGKNHYFKFCEFELEREGKKLTLDLEVIDEYKNTNFNKTTYSLQIYQNTKTISDKNHLYFPNNVFYKMIGDEADRIHLKETVVDGKVKCELFLKISTIKSTWNYSYVNVKFIDTNIYDLKLLNLERYTETLEGTVFSNSLKANFFRTKPCDGTNMYVKIADANFNFDGARSNAIIEITKGRQDNSDNNAYIKILFGAYSYKTEGVRGEFMNSRIRVLEHNNIKPEDISFIQNGHHIEIFCKYAIKDEYFDIEFKEHTFTNSLGREIQIKIYNPVAQLPSGNLLKYRAKTEEFLFYTVDNRNYKIAMEDYTLKLFDDQNAEIAKMCKTQRLLKFKGDSLQELKDHYNSLIDKLYAAHVLKGD